MPSFIYLKNIFEDEILEHFDWNHLLVMKSDTNDKFSMISKLYNLSGNKTWYYTNNDNKFNSYANFINEWYKY